MLRRIPRMLHSSLFSSRAHASVVSLTIAFATVFVAMPAAAAPTIAFATVNPDRNSPASNHVVRGANALPNGISFDDCEKDVKLTFHMTATAFTTGADTLQVWAGLSPCDTAAARTPPNGTCQPVSAPYALNQSFQVDVQARDLVYASLTGIASPPGQGGIVGLTSQTSDAVCSQRTASAGSQMNVVFLVYAAGGGVEAETSLPFNPMGMGLSITVDTVGPAAPTAPTIDIGDTLLKLGWTPAGDATDTAGFTVFCDPPPGKSTDAALSLPDGAGVCTDSSTTSVDSGAPQDSAPQDSAPQDSASADASDSATPSDASSATDSASSTCGTTTDGGACGSDVIKSNVNGSVLANIGNGYFVCPNTTSTSDKTSTKATVTGLTNDKQYAFGVSASDLVGNTGPVLAFDCGTPQAIDDFWNRYKEAGGGAGGTFCALEAVGLPVETSMMGLAFVIASLALARRRRR